MTRGDGPVNAARRARAALNRLAKWRAFLAGWELGTRTLGVEGDGPVRARRDAAEARLLLRAEVTAISSVLIAKGVCTKEQLWSAFAREADFLSEELSRRFPGVQATDVGLSLDQRAVETMSREGFPP